jgi:hypothetical protein
MTALALFGAGGVFALDLAVEITPTGELFPALELSQSAIGIDAGRAAGNGLLRIRILGEDSPRDVRLTLSTDGLRKPTVIDARIRDEVVLRPRLDWDVDALHALSAARRQVLRVKIEGRGFAPIERSIDVRVHPLDEALYYVREGDARIDLGWAFAAWVDPQHPVIDELLALAGIDEHDAHMQMTDRPDRLRQAQSIWTALERRGLRYAGEGAGISQGPNIYSQRVRLLSSTWDERVANCLDGSVLIASALERLGIGTFLVLVPGHAFVGFYPNPESREAEFLETTLLGHRQHALRPGEMESGQQVQQRAFAGFEAARKAGRASYLLAAPRLDGQHRPNYAIIDISTARTYGIMPFAAGWGDSKRDVPVASSPPADQRTQRSPSP